MAPVFAVQATTGLRVEDGSPATPPSQRRGAIMVGSGGGLSQRRITKIGCCINKRLLCCDHVAFVAYSDEEYWPISTGRELNGRPISVSLERFLQGYCILYGTLATLVEYLPLHLWYILYGMVCVCVSHVCYIIRLYVCPMCAT